MIRRFSTWTNRNPLIAVILGLLACFALMVVAHQWDTSETHEIVTALRTRT
jgi:hypothetical protein